MSQIAAGISSKISLKKMKLGPILIVYFNSFSIGSNEIKSDANGLPLTTVVAYDVGFC